MLLPQTAEYALRATLHLAAHEGALVPVGEIAEATGVPKNYLSKTLHQLVRAGVLRSGRGPTGGFRLGAPAEALTLARVVAPFLASEERRCLLGHGVCGRVAGCPVHQQWLPVATHIEAFFGETTVAELLRTRGGAGPADRPTTRPTVRTTPPTTQQYSGATPARLL